MLNAKDALGLQEDLAVMRANQARANLPPVRSASRSSGMGAVAVALGANQNSMEKLKSNLDKTTSNRNDVAAIAVSARETIAALVAEIAQLKGVSSDEVQLHADFLLSRQYDRHVDELMDRGSLMSDPRQDPETMRIRTWYTPSM